MENKIIIQGFQDLIVWQKSLDLAEEIYKLTGIEPFATDYGLCNQIRKAAVSIMSNIAEGHGRFSSQDYRRFLAIANGSVNEVRAQLMLAERLGYVGNETTQRLMSLSFEITKMVKVLRSRLN